MYTPYGNAQSPLSVWQRFQQPQAQMPQLAPPQVMQQAPPPPAPAPQMRGPDFGFAPQAPTQQPPQTPQSLGYQMQPLNAAPQMQQQSNWPPRPNPRWNPAAEPPALPWNAQPNASSPWWAGSAPQQTAYMPGQPPFPRPQPAAGWSPPMAPGTGYMGFARGGLACKCGGK